MSKSDVLEEVFWSKVDFDSHDEARCWPWRGTINKEGYGAFSGWDVVGKRFNIIAHRLAYELEVDDLPDYLATGLQVDHLCHDPETCVGGGFCLHRRCCNPTHLRITDTSGNNSRTRRIDRNAVKTHCPRGHSYSEENTYVSPSGSRVCRECGRAADRAYLRRKKEGQ